MPRTARIELRAEPEREARIRLAARLANESVTSFVLEAASGRAEEVIAAASTTVVPSDFFDALHAALEEPPAPSPALARASRRPRRVTQA
jgi:uncharacterized protein (DUF1778 family)